MLINDIVIIYLHESHIIIALPSELDSLTKRIQHILIRTWDLLHCLLYLRTIAPQVKDISKGRMRLRLYERKLLGTIVCLLTLGSHIFKFQITALFYYNNNRIMYPNYSNPQNTQNTNNPNSNLAKSPQSFAPYIHQPQFSNQPVLSPQVSPFNANRNVYASTIQPSTSSSFSSKQGISGFSKLQSMGRVIKEDPDPIIARTQEAPSSFQSPPSNTLGFKGSNDRGKLASSVIFQKNYDQDLHRFPGLNVPPTNSSNFGTSRLDALLGKKPAVQVTVQQQIVQTPEEKRKRQIDAIKQELLILNKKMENTVKKDGQSKPYFQLSSRRNTTVQNNISPASNTTQTNKPAFQPNTTETNKIDSLNSGNKAYFQPYSKGNGESILPNKPQIIPQAPTQPKSFITTVSQQPPKNETGGMFKKKNPYLSQDPTKNSDYTLKTFLLSPKGAVLSQAFKPDPIQIKQQAKVYQTVEPIKKIVSLQISAPKVFKKSDFAIGKKMGKGQFGEVMLVRHKITGFLCGMKVMSKKQIREEKYVNQIARQLSIQFYLNHRNVAPLYGYFEDEENVYLLIEYCTGGQLLQLLRKSHRMQEADTSPIIRQICQGLDYIHKEQIIHRDIKPQNILFNFNTVKICDFGWAVHCGSGLRKTVSGSPLYYSPQIVQETQYDEKIDIWAIGMMTYECILGKIPFKIYSELDLNRIVSDQITFPQYVDVTDDAKDFILGIMQKNPDDRMIMKDIFKHPFVRKHLNDKKLAPEIMEEFRRVIS